MSKLEQKILTKNGLKSSLVIQGFYAVTIFALTVQAQEGEVAPVGANAVDVAERQEAEAALNRLGEKSAEHYKRLAARPQSRHTILRQPGVLLSPEEERKQEETVAPPQRQSLARRAEAEFKAPDVVSSKNGLLTLNLEAAYAHNMIGKDPVYLRSFNGKLVGPTMRVKPGDKLRITLKNSMPGERWLPNMMNTLNSFNTTNIHYHGLHVSPNGISDNVLILVGPQETQQYEINIPLDHTPGTYWYHPHRHGSTAGNVASGMSGALIIEGGLDDIPEIKAAKERVMVLNQIPYIYKNTLDDPKSTKEKPLPKIKFDLKEGRIEVKYAEYIFSPGDWAALERYTTVNGVQLPVLRLRPGQIERWRIVDSGQREMINLRIIPAPTALAKEAPGINFHEIAVDGLALGKMIETPTLELWPGYRSDVLVQAPTTPGEYYLIDDVATASTTMSGEEKPLNYVARIIIQGEPLAMKLPTNAQMQQLRLPSIKDEEITGQQKAQYGILLVGEKPNQKAVFTIDGKSFDMETARTLKLNDVEEWTLRSVNDVGAVTHPFHIHVNPFEVTSIMAPGTEMENGQPKLQEQLLNGPVWRDTVKIPGNGIVKMRTRYTDFIGTFVQHCHILDHEDQGMMQLIDIVKKLPKAAANRPNPPSVGSVAADFTLPDANGKKHSLQEMQDKPVVLFFFKGHGCLHCAQQVRAFIDHYAAFAQQGIEVIGVTSDSPEALMLALADAPCPFLLLADPQGVAFAKYGCEAASGLLHGTFALNAKHEVAWRTIGASPYLGVKDVIQTLSAPRPKLSLQTDK
jgi:FtsP/CotA-like multicopper oxidase with cupredoxin domain/peroxiredoxin